MHRPNFFILGAPKCGTTALATWLSPHPEVFFSPVKEPHFFNTDGLTTTKHLSDYEALFQHAPSACKAVGEGSTRYLVSQNAVANILEYQPQAKFIVCLRNPLQMAPSLHAELLSQGQEYEPDFAKAWMLQKARCQGQHMPRTVSANPSFLQYGQICRLGAQLQRLYEQVPQEKVHTVLLGDIRSNPVETYNGVLAFLEVSKDQSPDFSPVNTAKQTRSPALAILTRQLAHIKRKSGLKASFGIAGALKKSNIKRGARDPVTTEMQDVMREYFEDDIQLLSTLLNRDLSGWLA